MSVRSLEDKASNFFNNTLLSEIRPTGNLVNAIHLVDTFVANNNLTYDNDPILFIKTMLWKTYLYKAHGETAQLVACYEKILELDPTNFELKSYLAYLFDEFGQPEKAFELLAEVIETDYKGLFDGLQLLAYYVDLTERLGVQMSPTFTRRLKEIPGEILSKKCLPLLSASLEKEKSIELVIEAFNQFSDSNQRYLEFLQMQWSATDAQVRERNTLQYVLNEPVPYFRELASDNFRNVELSNQ